MRRSTRFAAALAVALFAAAPAFAATVLTITSLGLTAPNANYGCPVASADCLSSMDYQLAGPAAATGTITINTAGTGVSLNIDVASITFSSVPSGGPNAVFTNVHYVGAANVMSGPGFVSQFPPSPAPGGVTGLYNGSPFSTGAAITLLSCSYGATSGQCGLAMGPAGFEIDGHKWLNTFDVFVSVAVPEASALVLALLGVAAGVTLRRR